MKKFLSLFLVAVLSLGAVLMTGCGDSTSDESSNESQAPETKTIRIGTYNIKHGADVSEDDGVDGADADADTLKVIADDIKSLDLDIVGLQEVDNLAPRSGSTNQIALLSEYTGYQYFYYMRAVAWPSSEYASAGSAILSKYPIIEGSSSTEELSRGDTWDAVRKLGHVMIDVDGTIFNFYNTHLTPLQPEVRAGEFQLINEATKDKEYCLLTGDFNCPSFDEFDVLENLTNFNCDENKFITFPRDQKFMDNICYSDEFKPVEGVGGVLENGHSDHSLLWAEFEYTPNTATKDAVKERTLNIGSFNIAGGREVNKDLRVLADDILEQELDIVGLQEVDYNASRSDYVDFMKELSTYTGYKYYQFYEAIDFTEMFDDHTGSYGIGILSKYPITSYENIKLTETDKAAWIEGRTLGHAVIDVNGTEINFFTTHLTIRSDSIRATEFQTLNEKLNTYKNVILTGDFNNDTLDEFDAITNLEKVNNIDNPFETYPENHRYIDNVIYSSEFSLVEGSEGMRVNTHSDHYMFYATLTYTVE